MSENIITSEYSPDGKLFALLDEHGILKIWDTEVNILKQEFTPNSHLDGYCTCFTWIKASKNSSKKSKKLRISIDNESFIDDNSYSLYIAFGTKKGNVSLYSYSTGEVEQTLKGEGHNGKINCLIFDKQEILYTGGEDGLVICWSISNGKRVGSWSMGNEKINYIAYLSQSQNLIIGTRQLKIFSLVEKKVVHTLIGHISDIVFLKTFEHDSTEYCLSSSKTERIINLWTIKAKHKYRNSTATLLMEDIAYSFSYKLNKHDNTLKVCVPTRSGVIHIYVINMECLKANKPIKPITTIQIASDSQKNIEPLLAITASLDYGSMKKELIFGYGDTQFLVFEKFALNFTEHIQVLIRTHPRKLFKKNNKQSNETISKTVVPCVSDQVHYQSSVVSRNHKKKDDNQMPLETRLQNLDIKNAELPKAQSKAHLLTQALHSKDANLLYAVLATDDVKVINLTLQKLPVQYVATLVNELTILMEQKQSNVKIAVNWLKALINTHSSQLMALGTNELQEKFGPCLGVIERRTNCLKELSKLNGRLQLMVTQIKRNLEEDSLTNESLVYEDGVDFKSDLEDEMIENENEINNDEWEDEEEDENHNDNNETESEEN